MRKYVAGFIALMISASLVLPFTARAEKTDEEFRAESSVTKSYLYPEDTVTVTLGLKDLTGFQTGVNAYTATLEYDNAIFQDVKQSDFESLGKWTGFEYNPENNKLIAYTKARYLADTDILRLKLKVKKEAEATSTFVRFNDITVSEGTTDVINNSEIKLDIVRKQGSSVNTLWGVE